MTKITLLLSPEDKKMNIPHTRREFLAEVGRGMLVASVGCGMATELGLAPALAADAPDTLDFGTPVLNQQARVDILRDGADPFSVAPADVLLSVFQTGVGDPLVSGYTHHSVDITALLNANLNTPLTLRFAETDNVNIFQFGVDNVVLEATAVPDSLPPSMVFLVLLGLCWAGHREQLTQAKARTV
jgi:hypothetical protein